MVPVFILSAASIQWFGGCYATWSHDNFSAQGPLLYSMGTQSIQLLYLIISDMLPGALETRLEHAARTSCVADCLPLLSLGLLTLDLDGR